MKNERKTQTQVTQLMKQKNQDECIGNNRNKTKCATKHTFSTFESDTQ